MKHTPGPWTTAEGPTYCAIRTDGRVIADMRLVGLHYNKADAALIAAAPDLLEALKSLIDMDVAYKRGPRVEEAVEVASAAIAKATGAA